MVHNTQKTLKHALGWLLFIVLFYNKDLLSDLNSKLIILKLTYFITIFCSFYLFYSILVPRFFKPGKYIWLALLTPLGILFFVCCRYFLEQVVTEMLFGFKNYYADFTLSYYWRDNYARAYLPAFSGFLLFALEETSRVSQREKLLKDEKQKAELAFLRSQFNPHFLFNALNFLYASAYKSNPRLAESILHLSSIFRYAVDSTVAQTVALKDEISLIENYIKVYKDRYNQKCYIEFDENTEDENFQIEPLLFIPFIENAFKHGYFNRETEPITSRLLQSKKKIVFEIRNKIKSQQKDAGSGVGLENVRKRLALLFPSKHQLTIESDTEYYEVKLIINL